MPVRATFLRKDVYYFEDQITALSKMILERSQKCSILLGKTFFNHFNALCHVEAKWNRGNS